MCKKTLPPQAAGSQSRCLSQLDAERIIHGVYPLDDLEAQLDHADSCRPCHWLLGAIVKDVLDGLEAA